MLAPVLIEAGAAHTYNTTGYNNLVSRRPAYLRAVLRAASEATGAAETDKGRAGGGAANTKEHSNGADPKMQKGSSGGIQQIRVLYADVDTVFLQNPLPRFDATTDLQIQSDAEGPRKCTCR